MNYVIAIGMFQALVATYLLRQNKNKADNLLLLLLLSIATHLSIKFVIFNFVNDADVRYQMNTFIGFGYGPLIYLYALKMKNEAFAPITKWYLFLPMILGGIAYLTISILIWASPDLGHKALQVYNSITTHTISLANMTFCILALSENKQIKETYKREKLLIKQISYLLAVTCMIGISFSILGLFYSLEANIFVRTICYTMLSSVCLIILRYKYVSTLQQNTMLQQVLAEVNTKQEQETASATERKSLLSEHEQREIWNKLQSYLKSTEAYTDTELSLEKLSIGIGVSKYHISETLNSYASKSFYQYINELRIQRVTDQMQSLTDKGLPVNILALAYDSGFKAKSSFNQYFKKITGDTPTAYIKSLTDNPEPNSLILEV